MPEPCVSVLMPCRNAWPYLKAAVQSVLSQPECLELLVADAGSSDGGIDFLESLVAQDKRIKIVSQSDSGPADALNRAFKEARGTLIGWLNADDLYPPGALSRAVAAFNTYPEWLMVFGEGEEFNSDSGDARPYPTLPATVGLDGFRSHCFICQPSVVFRRSMVILLGPFDNRWRTAFDFDYWLRAFALFPDRIGYLPFLQGRTRIHSYTITSQQRALVAMEATELLARHFGAADWVRLNGYALELLGGIAKPPANQDVQSHLSELFTEAAPWLAPDALAALQREWLTSAKPWPEKNQTQGSP